MDDYQRYIHTSRYARWLEKEKRRETWEETVDRYITFFAQRIEDSDMKDEDKKELLEILG